MHAVYFQSVDGVAANSCNICCHLVSGDCENAISLKINIQMKMPFFRCLLFKRLENFQTGNNSYVVVFAQKHFNARSDIISSLHSRRKIKLGW